MEPLFESFERFFQQIDQSMVIIKDAKVYQFQNAERMVIEKLSLPIVDSNVNNQRKDLLQKIEDKRREDLRSLNSCIVTSFEPSQSPKCFDDLILNLNSSLVFRHGFSVEKKISYMHLLPKPNEYVDFDLFDIKHPHSAIKISEIIGTNRIFLFIFISKSNYVLQLHQINRSSIATGRQIHKKSIFKYDFEFFHCRIVAVFNYRLIEIYDVELNLLKQLDLTSAEGDFRIYKQILANNFEFIIDFTEYYKIYDHNFDSSQRLYINNTHDLQLVNLSKTFIFYSTPTKSFIQLVSRQNSQVVCTFSMSEVFSFPNSDFNLNLSFFVEFGTSFLYFKGENSNIIFRLEFDSSDQKDHRLIEIQNKYNLVGFQFRVLLDENISFGEPTVLVFKRNISTNNLKVVYIF